MPTSLRTMLGVAAIVGLPFGLPLSAQQRPQYVVVSHRANGFPSPDESTEPICVYGQFDQLTALRKFTAQPSHEEFILVEGSHGKKVRKGSGSVPNHWVRISDLLPVAALKKWVGKWPIEKLSFTDGVVGIQATIDAHGDGEIVGEIRDPERFQVYSAGGVVELRVMTAGRGYSFWFNYDQATMELSSESYTDLHQSKRD